MAHRADPHRLRTILSCGRNLKTFQARILVLRMLRCKKLTKNVNAAEIANAIQGKA
jgi:hypothetical protein